MGAVDFTTFSKGATIRRAFDSAYAQQGYEDGHCYSGTIASMSYFQEFPSPPVPLGYARQIAEREFEAEQSYDEEGMRRTRKMTVPLEKGSNAVGIPVADAAAFKTRSKTVTLTLSGQQSYLSTGELVRLAGIELSAGELVTEAEIVERSERFSVKAKATTGKTITKFFVTTPSGQELPGQKGFPTQAEARAAAVKLLSDERRGGGYREGLGVVGKKLRESGAPLVSITRENARQRIKVRFKIAKPKTTRPKIIGWLFYGIAPH